jgi:hypothetical protein
MKNKELLESKGVKFTADELLNYQRNIVKLDHLNFDFRQRELKRIRRLIRLVIEYKVRKSDE